ncbi:hypothetical protein [Lentibacillus saliphilus]|uniref:hypothetical protein n=1 Tax=Lentibacillus saliphilus TaxID=2737028 RepID=UPI001C2F4178|nr:hypothetical protein [Lentibacillus saliphilus]
MSWKSVEMQVALPRVQEAGKMQDQMLKHHQQFQESLAQTHTKQQKLERQQVNDSEHVKNNPDSNDASSKHHASDQEQKDDRQQEEKHAHPYLGNHIDLSR